MTVSSNTAFSRLQIHRISILRSGAGPLGPTSGAGFECVAGAGVAAVGLAAAPAAPNVQPESDIQGSFLADVLAKLIDEAQPIRAPPVNGEPLLVDVLVASGAQSDEVFGSGQSADGIVDDVVDVLRPARGVSNS